MSHSEPEPGSEIPGQDQSLGCLVRYVGMRRSRSCVLLSFAVASTALWAACGGGTFTAAPSADADGATESSAPGADGTAPPPTGNDAGGDAGSDASTHAGGDGGADGGSLPDAGPDVSRETSMPAPGCPTGGGPAMLLVGGFCIDSTEVTSAQYNAFLLAGPSTSGQPSECSWNASYLPGNGWTFSPSEGTLPIANVDWCDAYAFCKWAGKRLCGKVGGGAADFQQFASTENEHYVACSNNATRVYPYGNTFDSTACNGVERATGHVVPVGSLTACQGGVPGLFDISGNVEEWQNACNGNSGANDSCLDGTGAFDFGAPPDGTRCDFADSDARNGQFPDVGFRCCASPP